MHLPVRRSARDNNILSPDKRSINNKGYDFLFSRIKKHLSASHITVGNMEFPVSPPFKSVPWIFNCYPDVIPALKKSGFTMVSIANNHILDQGIKGIKNTLHYLNKYNMDFIGVNSDESSARSGLIKNIDGIKIGFIAYSGYLNYKVPKKQKGFYINRLYNKKNVIQDIVSIKKKCRYLIMIVHSGKEYSPVPLKKDIRLLKEYINSGVDLIIRHHPHILQKAEKIISKDKRECYIFYSLGNFISNQGSIIRSGKNRISISTRDSVIVTLILTENKNSLKSRFKLLPITTVNRNRHWKKKRIIQTVSIPDLINSLKSEEGEKQDKRTKRKLKSLLNKIETIKKIIFRNQKIDEIKIIEHSKSKS